MIKHYSLNALQKAINRALSLDESRLDKIKELEGKVLKVIITPLGVSFFIAFRDNQLQLLADYDQQVNTVIESSPLGLIRLSFLPASKVRSLFNDQIKITGDTELGQDIKRLFDELDIDWEGHLAQFTGDVVAYQIGSLVRNGLDFTRQTKRSLRQNLTEYLQEELRLFPSREEVDDFFNDVDSVSLDVERLSARINLLLVRHEAD